MGRTSSVDTWSLPDEWQWVRIDEVCEVNPRRRSVDRKGDAPTSFLPMAGVDELSGAIVDPETRPYYEVSRGYTYFEEGDVLFAKITPSMQNGKSAIAQGLIDGFGFGSTEFHVLRPSEKVLPEWIHLFVRQISFREEATTHFRGSVGQQRVPSEFLTQHLIPVPSSLTVQRRIVARVEVLSREIRAAQRVHGAFVHDAHELMDVALTETFRVIQEREATTWATIGSVGEVMGGVTKNRRRSSYPLRLPYLRVANVYANELRLDDVQEIGVLEKELGRLLLQPYDLLVIEGNGSIDQIGRVAVWDGSIDPCIHQNHIIKVRFGGSVDSKYALYWLLSPLGRDEIVKVASSTSGLYTLSLSKVSALPIPLIPMPLQQQVIDQLDEVRFHTDELQRSADAISADLERLEQSILSQAFRGVL